jgi:xanthine dehydrogenase large subunit
MGRAMGASVPHESALGHVTGAALYTDDLTPRYPGILHAWPVMAPHAHARVVNVDVLAATRAAGVVAVLTEADVPGEGNTGAARHDEPMFPTMVLFHGQPVAWVLGETVEAARLGADLVHVQYEPLPAILTIQEAIASDSFLTDELRVSEGSAAEIFDRGFSTSGEALIEIEGEIAIGGQEHFYLETQASIAWIDESGGMAVHSSTQHPSETQDVVARVLGIARHQVTVECLRMGGAFGGKEVQANPYAAVAALGAWKTRRPVSVRLARGLDIALTGKRHPYLARYRAGFSADGRIQALQLRLYSDGGWSLDLSEPVMFRSLFHCDNAYRLPNVEAIGRVCRTNKTSQTAFRGFGGPQAMVVIEEIMSRAAHRLAIPSHVIRERNFYRDGDHTHYGQVVSDAGRIARIWTELKQTSDFDARHDEIDRFNASHSNVRRGLAITPVKFGISFTATFYNQAGALVLAYRDGSVQVNHGGTEMGQGLHTKIQQIAADALGLPLTAIRLMSTRTDKVPNTSATAASAGTDLNGAAVADACGTIRERLVAVAAQLLECQAAEVTIANGIVRGGSQGGTTLSFAALCEAAYLHRVPLFAQGFYRTPEIHFDRATGRGKPFHYFAFGAAVSEVEVDRFTGAYRLIRTDILQDVGSSVSLNIDRGQVEGGFIQGVGWLTLEELIWDAQGRVATAGASTYKLPSWSEVPDVFNVGFLERADQPSVIGGSKAVGEPPLMLAISVREALRNAIQAFGHGAEAVFDSPATPERVFFATKAVRAAAVAHR